EWRNTNEAAFNEVASGTQYQPVTTPQGPGTIYKKVIKSGTGTESPISTARVKVFYIGKFYDGTVFDPGSGEEVPAYFPAKTSTSYTNNGVISGFSIALQNMVIGDKWEIWIPWSLGYGSSSYGSIPGYSTLVFEVELLGFEQYPDEAK
ncbi:MAG: FKBP-type peptidyl-prolyl cis-trans isomerase, partial [Dysgonamonadaceae bacterium]|nr:FKBP-type peptidyl-prolyl cis-trans isomerase [Dysgonamonadaceae bacterium]